MSLAAVFAAVAPRLPNGVRFAGPEGDEDVSRAPSITWNPISASHIAARGLGRDIMARQWDILVDIWGEDLAATEALTNAFLAAAHDILSANGYRPGAEVWLTGGATAQGARCKLTFSLVTPIPKTVLATVPVETLQGTYKIGETEVAATITSD